MFGRKRAAPSMNPIDLGKRMHASMKATKRAGVLLRATGAASGATPCRNVAVPLSDAPVGLHEVARALADLQHYCAGCKIPWGSAQMLALDLLAAEIPPAPPPKTHHGGRRR